MKISLSTFEEDVIGDLAQDSHELWELYAFARNHYEKASDEEILKRGNELLSVWVERGWLKAFESRSSLVAIEPKQLLIDVHELGQAAVDPKKGSILLALTDRASSDIEWLREGSSRSKDSE